ncbi:hypothetical protein LXL04_004400 [Taraxacum kok-saghyz]
MVAVNESSIKGYPHASISSKSAFEWTLNKIICSNTSGGMKLMLVQMRTIIEIENGGTNMDGTHIFPRTRELPQFPISPKPLFLSKNRLRNPPKPVLKQNKKLCTYAQKKCLHICKVFGKKSRFFGNFFLRPGLLLSDFQPTEVGFSKKLTVWEFSVLGSFENSYIPENPRTPPISYISQTVIPFKKPTSEPCKTGFETKQKTVHICTKKKFAHMQSFWKKKKSFFRKIFFATGLIFERFLAPRSRFFEKVNGLGVLGSWFKREQIMKTRTREQTWSLDQFKPPDHHLHPPDHHLHPPPDHRRTTVGPPSVHHLHPPPDHRRTTAGPPSDHRLCTHHRTTVGAPPAPTTGPPLDHRRTTAGPPLVHHLHPPPDHHRTTVGPPAVHPPPDHRRCTTCTHHRTTAGPPSDHRLCTHHRTTAGPPSVHHLHPSAHWTTDAPPPYHRRTTTVSEIRMTLIYDADAEADEEMLTLMNV